MIDNCAVTGDCGLTRPLGCKFEGPNASLSSFFFFFLVHGRLYGGNSCMWQDLNPLPLNEVQGFWLIRLVPIASKYYMNLILENLGLIWYHFCF